MDRLFPVDLRLDHIRRWGSLLSGNAWGGSEVLRYVDKV